MTKRKLFVLCSGTLIALLVASWVGVNAVSAQEPTPEPEPGTPHAWPFGGRRMGGPGHGMFDLRQGRWTAFDTAAEALGLTPEELFAESHGGKSLEEIAEEQGIDMETLQDTMSAAHREAMEQAIQQAVEDGKLTQEQADSMLERLEQGGFPDRSPDGGFDRDRGRGPQGKGSPPPPPPADDV